MMMKMCIGKKDIEQILMGGPTASPFGAVVVIVVVILGKRLPAFLQYSETVVEYGPGDDTLIPEIGTGRVNIPRVVQ